MDPYANVTSPSRTDLFIRQRSKALQQKTDNKKVRLGNWKKQMKELGYTIEGNVAYDGSGSVRHSFAQHLKGVKPSVIKNIQAPSQRSDYSNVDLRNNEKLSISSVLPQAKYNQYGVVTNQAELDNWGLGGGGISQEMQNKLGLPIGTTQAGVQSIDNMTEIIPSDSNTVITAEGSIGKEQGKENREQLKTNTGNFDKLTIPELKKRIGSGARNSVLKNKMRLALMNKNIAKIQHMSEMGGDG